MVPDELAENESRIIRVKIFDFPVQASPRRITEQCTMQRKGNETGMEQGEVSGCTYCDN
jgi:hypothetical protein